VLAGSAFAALATLGIVRAAPLVRAPAVDARTAGHRIAVLPFSVSGGEELAWLGPGMADLLSMALDGAGPLRAVDPYALDAFVRSRGTGPGADVGGAAARRFGARRYVVGSVVGAGGRLRIRATVYDTGDRPGRAAPVHASAEGAVDDALALVDDLAAQLIARYAASPGERLVRVAALTTHSLPALKSYLAGEALFRSGAFVMAADSFRSAGERDSTFALAHYRLALATLWADREGASADGADERALLHSARLGARDRLGLRAYHAWRHGDADRAEQLYREVVAAYPDDVEAWFQLGETLFHYNPLRGRPIDEARAPLERVLALDPAHRGAAWHLALLAAHARRTSELQRLTRRLLALSHDTDARAEIVTFRRLAGLQADRPVAPDALPPLQRATLAWRAAVFLGRADEAERLLERNGTDAAAYWRYQAGLDRAYLQLAAGRHRTALALLDGAEASAFADPVLAGTILHARLIARDVLALVPGAGAAASHVSTPVRWTTEASYAGDALAATLQSYHAGIAAALSGDTASLGERERELARHAAAAPTPDLALALAATLRAHRLRAAARPDLALDALAERPLYGWYGIALSSPLRAMTHQRFLRAELLLEAGRPHDALGWYRSFGEHALHDLAYLAPAQYRLGQIHERLGNRREAARHYARAVELWSDADPELLPLAASARARAAELGGARRAFGARTPWRRWRWRRQWRRTRGGAAGLQK
jgi:tetratricopeptide (TPR) repeat protein